MEHEFWHERWSKKEIGFHEGSVNKFLYDHWPELSGGGTEGVFVPLCGKAHDMWWLHDRGHPIIGVELSDVACKDFFEEVGEKLFEVFDGDGNQVIDNLEIKKPRLVVFRHMEKRHIETIDYHTESKSTKKNISHQEFLEKSKLSRFDKNEDGLSPLDFLEMPFNQVNVKDDAVIDAALKVCEAAAKVNRTVGIFVADLNDVPYWRDQGVSLFLLSSDHGFIKSGINELLSKTK